MSLSILICTMPSRRDKLAILLGILQQQIIDSVEVLVCSDDKIISVGHKRNILVSLATKEYVAFIDDDDTVSNDYIKLVLEAISSKPDCVGIEGIITVNGGNPKKFTHSLQHNEWKTENDVYYRPPNHLNPIKRSIAGSIKFPEINFGEDRVYSDAIKNILQSEVYIKKPIYHYLYNQQSTTSRPPKSTKYRARQVRVQK